MKNCSMGGVFTPRLSRENMVDSCRYWLWNLAFSTSLIVACAEATEPPPEPRRMHFQASAYLSHAFDLMQIWSVNKYVLDWPVLQDSAFERAADAQTVQATYPAIRQALDELGDNHSFFLPADWTPQPWQPGGLLPWPDGRRIDSTVGYVMIPHAMPTTAEELTAFATDLQAIIKDVDTLGLCGWIVDLRANGGGSMWPMLAGVGPILGAGLAGSFIDPDSVREDWGYNDGTAWYQTPDTVWAAADGDPYELINPEPSVAVLTGPLTGSSGEAIVVAFRARPKTRSFGMGTAGLSTCIRGFRLTDGARLMLATSTFADRTGLLYGGVIEPDTVVRGWNMRFPTMEDRIIEVAKNWLTNNGDCGS